MNTPSTWEKCPKHSPNEVLRYRRDDGLVARLVCMFTERWGVHVMSYPKDDSIKGTGSKSVNMFINVNSETEGKCRLEKFIQTNNKIDKSISFEV